MLETGLRSVVAPKCFRRAVSAFDFGALDRTGKSNTRRELYIGMEKVAIAIAEKKGV